MLISRRIFLSTATAVATTPILKAVAYPETTIRVSYAPAPFKVLYEALSRRFMDMRPDIKVVLDPPVLNYDDLIQQTLRQGITKQMPDVSHQGLNQIRPLATRKIAVPLDDFIAGDQAWRTIGIPDSMSSLAYYLGKTYGLPFGISIPVLFYNADLVKQAGGDPNSLPTNWDGIIELGKKIDALGAGISGFYVEYANKGWSFQTLVGSLGGRIMSEDERKIEFDGPAGLQTLRLLQRFGREGQPAFGTEQARQAFRAGTLGIIFTSSSGLSGFQQSAAGKFELKVGQFPISSTNAKLPAGGNGIVMLTEDSKKQKAAWEYIKFAVGPVGQNVMVQTTSYAPVNIAAIKDPDGLGKFYEKHREYEIANQCLPLMTVWYSFPGENNSKIVKIIDDYCHVVVSQRLDPAIALSNLRKEVEALLPR